MKEIENLNGLGMVTQASVFRVRLGSTGVAHGGANNAGQAPEHRFGSPEASEGK